MFADSAVSPNKWKCRRQGRVRCHALTQQAHDAKVASMYCLDGRMSQAHIQAYPQKLHNALK